MIFQNASLEYYSSYEEQLVEPIAHQLFDLMKAAPASHHNSVSSTFYLLMFFNVWRFSRFSTNIAHWIFKELPKHVCAVFVELPSISKTGVRHLARCSLFKILLRRILNRFRNVEIDRVPGFFEEYRFYFTSTCLFISLESILHSG